MIIFGWFVLLIITIAACVATGVVFFGSIGWSGKAGVESLFFAVIAGLLVWATCANFPFVVAVAS
jgi:hypothetical protein